MSETETVENKTIKELAEPVEPTENKSAGDNEQNGQQKQKRVWLRKKPRYDGRYKKRQWEDRSKDAENGIDRKRACFNPEDRVKKRKFCLLMGYSGANYLGMQRNPSVKTIEEELLKALLANKYVSDENFRQPQNIHFQRAARTDKGVSAVRQLCSMKLPEEVSLDKLNECLPPEIKIFNIKRVTKGFNAKDQCDARTYSYTLPTITFADHKDSSTTLQGYRVTPEKLAKVKETLKMFEGTRNFHNFTSRKSFADPSANRFINLFECGDPFIVRDVEFASIIVKGQSFMLHQIRKMIGLLLAVVREVTSDEAITRSFKENRIDIPMAPGLGLVLDQVHYDGYNNRYRDDGIHDLLLWDEYESEIQEFREKFINPVIIDTEINEQPMVKWLETLPLHTYDERSNKDSEKANAEANAEDDLDLGSDDEGVVALKNDQEKDE